MDVVYFVVIKVVRVLSWVGLDGASDWVGEQFGLHWRLPYMLLDMGKGTRADREEWFRDLQTAKGRPDLDWNRMWRDLVIEERPE